MGVRWPDNARLAVIATLIAAVIGAAATVAAALLERGDGSAVPTAGGGGSSSVTSVDVSGPQSVAPASTQPAPDIRGSSPGTLTPAAGALVDAAQQTVEPEIVMYWTQGIVEATIPSQVAFSEVLGLYLVVENEQVSVEPRIADLDQSPDGWMAVVAYEPPPIPDGTKTPTVIRLEQVDAIAVGPDTPGVVGGSSINCLVEEGTRCRYVTVLDSIISTVVD